MTIRLKPVSLRSDTVIGEIGGVRVRIAFEKFGDFHFALLAKWLNAPHVKTGQDASFEWTEASVREKYGSHALGHKTDAKGIARPIHAYIVRADDVPVGYVQLHNAYDFGRQVEFFDLPKRLGAVDIFMGEVDFLRKGIASAALNAFCSDEYCRGYAYVFADPAASDVALVKTYAKAGFKKTKRVGDVLWMTRKPSSSFAFNAENLEKIEAIVKKYPKDHAQSAVMPLLDLAQRQNGNYISDAVIETVAEVLGMPSIRVFEMASFYNMYNLDPVGEFHVQVCGTTPCMLRGSEAIFKLCETELGITKDQVTVDGKFSLTEVECLGACVNAPIVKINDDYYEDLSVEGFTSILLALKNGERPEPGSLTGRQCSKAAS